MRRTTASVIAAAVLIAVGIGGWWAIDRFSEENQEAEPAEELELVAVTVVRTDLVDRETLDATLRYAEPSVMFAQLAGTVTALPPAGTTLNRGDVAFEIDGNPVILMLGERPSWRRLSEDSADGADIRQLEENLVALGYDSTDLAVDEEFTATTKSVVEDWQIDVGVDDTGIVELGTVVFAEDSVRVAAVLVDVGATIGPGSPLLTTSASSQEVQLWLDADRQDLAEVGDSVGVELPDESTTTGVVTEISDVVSTIGTGPEARKVFEVIIQLDDIAVAAGLDEAPVKIEVISEEVSGVLAVPVNALLALAEGGYAVEVRQPDGSSMFVPVTIGKFADGVVAVTGGLAEGDQVLVPR